MLHTCHEQCSEGMHALVTGVAATGLQKQALLLGSEPINNGFLAWPATCAQSLCKAIDIAPLFLLHGQASCCVARAHACTGIPRSCTAMSLSGTNDRIISTRASSLHTVTWMRKSRCRLVSLTLTKHNIIVATRARQMSNGGVRRMLQR